MKDTLITDSQQFTGAKSRFGHSIPVYDDGYGPLFIHRNSIGITAIVRAQTWEDAYAICEDEFFPAADEEAGEEMARIEAMEDGEEKNHALNCFEEAYGYRNNTRREKGGGYSGIYAKDLNGDALDLLTPELVEQLEIVLEIVNAFAEVRNAAPASKPIGAGNPLAVRPIETETYTLPAHWASYLINGDASGFDIANGPEAAAELATVDAWIAAHPGRSACDVGAEYFSHRNDAGTLAGTVADFTFLVTDAAWQ